MKESNQSYNNDFAILINSCDAYSDLWEPFLKLLIQFWPESIHHKTYINAENRTVIDAYPYCTVLGQGHDGTDLWGRRLIEAIDEINDDYILLLMDDFFLEAAFDEKIIENCVREMKVNPHIASYYLIPIPKIKVDANRGRRFIEIPKQANYRLNSAPAIWRKSSLSKYLRENDNPWAWEYFGTCRTRRTDDIFYCVGANCKPVYEYAHAIYRGKWLYENVSDLNDKYELEIDFTKRGLIGSDECLPKRSLKWKIDFIRTGISMVGPSAIIEVAKDYFTR